jgi:hypothetical protein
MKAAEEAAILSDQAMGRRVVGSEFQKDITLRYAVPPPRPTDAYAHAVKVRRATTSI